MRDLGTDKLVLPEEVSRIKSLEDKLVEYKARIVRLTGEVRPDADVLLVQMYKTQVLSKLLDKKQLDVYELLEEASKQEYFKENLYCLAINVIHDYCTTGGKNLYGGTGLKLPDRNRDGKISIE